MTTRTDYSAYVRDLVYLLREAAADARRRKAADPNESHFHEGRESAFIEALLFMQSQADSFAIPRKEFELDAFDPLKDPLDPPNPGRDL